MHKDKAEFEPIYKAAKMFLSNYNLIYEDEDNYSAIYLAKNDGTNEKKKFVNLEEKYDFMRFVDIDVIDTNLKPISRSDLGLIKRNCVVCGGDRFACMHEDRHSQEDFNARLDKILLNLDK